MPCWQEASAAPLLLAALTELGPQNNTELSSSAMFSDSNRPLPLCQALPALSGLPSSGEGPEPPPPLLLLLLLWPCVQ